MGLVFALGFEAGPVLDRMTRKRSLRGANQTITEGELSGIPVALLVGGPGDAAAARLPALIEGHRPAWVLSAGFAAGLAPGLKQFDLFRPSRVADESGRVARLSDDDGPALITVDRILRTPEEKADLHRRTGADLADMETFPLAEACARAGIPLVSLRIISDAAEDPIPPEVAAVLKAGEGVKRWGAVAGAIFRRPTVVRDFWNLGRDGFQAAEKLADAVVALVQGANPA